MDLKGYLLSSMGSSMTALAVVLFDVLGQNGGDPNDVFGWDGGWV